MTERRKFDLVKKIEKVEIRRYHPCVMADVLVNSEFERAGNIGFRPLVTYISQNKIAMTAPVIQQEGNAGSWVVSFVMPSGKSLSDFPVPKDSKVSLRHVPEEFAAALPFSGFTNQRTVARFETELRKALIHEGITVTGSLQIARFDPPWKPSFLRYNEVILPINY